MENKMNYTKAMLLFLSGIISVAVSLYLGTKSEGYGFLVGYGYTALAGGLMGMLYTYFKNRKVKKQGTAQ